VLVLLSGWQAGWITSCLLLFTQLVSVFLAAWAGQHQRSPHSYTRSVAASLPLRGSFYVLLEAFTAPIQVRPASLGAAGMLAGSWGGPGAKAHAFRSTVHLQHCRRDCMGLRK